MAGWNPLTYQMQLDLSSAPAKEPAGPRKPHERGKVVAPFCEECTAAGRVRRLWSCKPCRALYQAAWNVANPEHHRAIQKRSEARLAAIAKAKAEFAPVYAGLRSKSFKERYRTDVAFREKHKARSRKWDEANPEYVAKKRSRWHEQERAGKHEPVVYFVRSYLTGLVKIGTTNNLRRRLSTFRNSHPGRLEVLGTMAGGREVEQVIHRRFAAQRFDREWFTETPALVEFIVANASDVHVDLGGVKLAPIGRA